MLMSGVLKHPDKGQIAASNVHPDSIFSPVPSFLLEGKYIKLDGSFRIITISHVIDFYVLVKFILFNFIFVDFKKSIEHVKYRNLRSRVCYFHLNRSIHNAN